MFLYLAPSVVSLPLTISPTTWCCHRHASCGDGEPWSYCVNCFLMCFLVCVGVGSCSWRRIFESPEVFCWLGVSVEAYWLMTGSHNTSGSLKVTAVQQFDRSWVCLGWFFNQCLPPVLQLLVVFWTDPPSPSSIRVTCVILDVSRIKDLLTYSPSSGIRDSIGGEMDLMVCFFIFIFTYWPWSVRLHNLLNCVESSFLQLKSRFKSSLQIWSWKCLNLFGLRWITFHEGSFQS